MAPAESTKPRQTHRNTHVICPTYTLRMSSLYRSALVWLLLFSLPLQGYAAATMLSCGPNHHQMWAAAVTATVSHHDSGEARHEHHHAHTTADDHDVTASGDVAGDGASVHRLNKLSKFKCSACAACCVGAALPTSPLEFLSFPPAVARDCSVPAAHVGFFTDGPDRPPRLPLV